MIERDRVLYVFATRFAAVFLGLQTAAMIYLFVSWQGNTSAGGWAVVAVVALAGFGVLRRVEWARYLCNIILVADVFLWVGTALQPREFFLTPLIGEQTHDVEVICTTVGTFVILTPIWLLSEARNAFTWEWW